MLTYTGESRGYFLGVSNMVLEGVRIALKALLENKLRTFLTLLGNIVGTMSVIAVVSLIGGIDDYIREEVANEGSNVFTVERVNFLEAITDLDEFLEALARNKRILLEDADYLRKNIPSASSVGAAADNRSSMSYRDNWVDRAEVRGRSVQYPVIENVKLYAGRHLSRLEIKRSNKVAVIGWDVYKNLFDGRSPIGRTLKIGREHFEVIGIAEDRGTVFGESRNRFVYIPVTRFLKMYGSRESISIKVKAADVELLGNAVEQAEIAMRIRHGLHPTERNDFSISTSKQLVSLWENISSSIFKALIFLVSIALVVGGVVLMNVMLVSVTERTREVGIRKAIGARRLDIIWQFIVESITLSLLGGIIGIALGFTIAAVISLLSPLPYLIAPWSIAAGLTVTFLIGVIFGTYPASKASRLDPVVALHHE
ncbi:MAG: ABC transporter permease [Candidatus Krumholzibacteriota bacterium]|nr:ABC transporter permease [Candidatus Krumholzibacteriota bacterium]